MYSLSIFALYLQLINFTSPISFHSDIVSKFMTMVLT